LGYKGTFKTITKEFFVEESIKVHGKRYNYDLLPEIIKKSDKVKIICNNHEIFEQNFNVHIIKKCGCRKCGNLLISKAVNKSMNYYINKANEKFNNKFIYTPIEFTKKVTVVCPIHGEFIANIKEHINSIHGCKKCAVEVRKNKISYNVSSILSKFKQIHGDKYDYSLVNYVNRQTPIKIICPTHGEFITTPEVHLKGCNCPYCVITGWDKTSWINLCNNTEDSNPVVYIIKCFNDNEFFIKIGRTKRSIYHRFLRPSIMPYKYEVLKIISGTPEEIYDKEVELRRLYQKYKYFPKILFPGNTECFSLEILNLINKNE
jgi:hypothetical protein